MQIGFDSIVTVIKVFIDTLNSPSVPSFNDSWSHRIMLDAMELCTDIPMRYDSLAKVTSNSVMYLQSQMYCFASHTWKFDSLTICKCV